MFLENVILQHSGNLKKTSHWKHYKNFLGNILRTFLEQQIASWANTVVRYFYFSWIFPFSACLYLYSSKIHSNILYFLFLQLFHHCNVGPGWWIHMWPSREHN